MAVRIEVAYREGVKDAPGEKLKSRIKAELGRTSLSGRLTSTRSMRTWTPRPLKS